ncbi:MULTISPECIES: hypothetical protein [Furfurilactobacillus]|uniref:Uncharacterized protein n=2 Tax=Furfurilactobacillus TaxID=2767882 RepID=A0A0R1RL08_9LACO|nr:MULTISPECIES: hypothetical protein [Furfurilactobacillus]KRL55860.1 hypothetical protein FD35_GL002392 [Furfurilactobacillus rossiae DSM 15814]MCF6165099.1 hypothetical protein [Furfurilactobacillus rossiae]MCF6418427.1 hypothetical protein [Furfurilactobacillus milii]MYV17821.1 hypothetical protein [Furfurilactobacillus milii]QFR67194.1 hypothetical protein LR814_08815 [Furfurilactobacillus rossiae]
MLNEDKYDYDVERLGQLRDELQRLEDNDYVTAYYKGYSSEGLTLDEVRDTIKDLEQQIRQLERELDEDGE